jgi:hypothetical protein
LAGDQVVDFCFCQIEEFFDHAVLIFVVGDAIRPYLALTVWTRDLLGVAG